MPRAKSEDTTENINICLNCNLKDCISDTLFCPLRRDKVQKKRMKAKQQYERKKYLKIAFAETKKNNDKNIKE